MYVKSLGAEVRIHRARRVLADLAAQHDAYLGSGAVRLETAHGSDAWRVRVDHEPPDLAPLVAQVVRTTRSALDDLATSLVIASRRTPRATSFPIASSAHDFAEEQYRCLRRANERARSAVRSVTPWKGADDRLWELRLLDTSPPVVHLGQLLPPAPARVPVALSVLQTAPPATGTQHPLGDSSPLVLRDPTATRADQAALLQASLFLVLGNGDLVRGRPVVSSLELLVTHAADVIARVVTATASPA